MMAPPEGWRTWAVADLAVLAVCLATYLPAFAGWVTCNPLHLYPGLAAAA